MIEDDKELEEIAAKMSQNGPNLPETSEVNNLISKEDFEQNKLTVVDETKTIETFKETALANITSRVQKGETNLEEGLKEFVEAVATVNALKDPEVSKTLTANAAKSLKSHSRAGNYKDETTKIERRTTRNEAFYKAFRPILEFDLSHLVGKKRKKIVTKDPATGKKTITYETLPEEPKKTYEDRSYGMALMMLMIALFIIPYCVANVILAVFNAINALFECFTKFGRTAFLLCTSIAGIAIIGLVLYVILLIIQAAFGVQIFA